MASPIQLCCTPRTTVEPRGVTVPVMNRLSPMLRIALDLARDQDGVVSRRQLMFGGVPARTISNAIQRLFLFPVFVGVFLVGRPHLSFDGLLAASLLAAGDGAVLGKRTAAAQWGFLDHRNPIEVLRPRRGGNQLARVRVEGEGWWPQLKIYQSLDLPETDLSVKRGRALTSPARALRDSAGLLSDQRFQWAFMEADRLGLLSDRSLNNLANSTQGRKGAALFREMVHRRIPNIEEARSLLEAIVLDLVDKGQIPAPEINRKTHAYRPDFRWRSQGVLVEADGYEFHRGREAFENDVLRANRLRAEGWTVLRFTWRMVTERPSEVAAMIRQTLLEKGPKVKK